MLVLSFLYGLSYSSITNDQHNNYGIIKKSPPQGKAYLPYCEGGFSNELMDIGDNSCYAERPGDFAKFAILVYAVFAALLFPLVFILSKAILNKIKKLSIKYKKLTQKS